jgi:DNA repair protein RadD
MTHRDTDIDRLFDWGEQQEEFENAIAAAVPRELRPYQQTCLDLIADAYATGARRIVLQLPTGGGKTLLASSLIKQFEYLGTAYFIAPRLVLIGQTTKSFEHDGIGNIGVIQGKQHRRANKLARVQVASAQTLCRRPVPENFGLAIVDECHIHNTYLYKLMALPAWKNILFVGLSATPWSRGLGKHFKTLLKPTSIRELVAAEFLVPPKIFCPPGPDLSGVHVDKGEFVNSELSAAVNTKEIVGDVIKTWVEKGEGRPTIVYGVDCKHSQHLQERFREAGIPAGYMDGKTIQSDRDEIFKSLENGDSKILCNVRTCDTGLDLPFVSCIVDARPTRSYILEVQTIGRGLRPFPGKKDCIVLDHSGNVRRLGDPLDIDFAGLDDGDPPSADKKYEKSDSPDAIFCHACHAQLPIPKPRKCPECGEIFWAITQVRERDGELLEYGSESTGPAAKIPLEVKQHWYGAFLWHLGERGKKPGAAYHLFIAKFKEKPPYSWLTTVKPVQPSVEQRNFIKARAIAYAKAMARNG